MTKRKHITDERREEVEQLSARASAFSCDRKSQEELTKLHRDLDCLIDDNRLAPSLVSDAKRLRCYLKQHLFNTA